VQIHVSTGITVEEHAWSGSDGIASESQTKMKTCNGKTVKAQDQFTKFEMQNSEFNYWLIRPDCPLAIVEEKNQKQTPRAGCLTAVIEW
jgi:hypothetical protein